MPLSFNMSVSLLSVRLSIPSLCFCLFVTNSPTLFGFFLYFLHRLISSVACLSFPSFPNSIHSSIFVSALSSNKAVCFYLSRTHRKEPPNYAQTLELVKEKKQVNWIASLNQFTSNCDGSVIVLPMACPVLPTWWLSLCKLSHRLLLYFPGVGTCNASRIGTDFAINLFLFRGIFISVTNMKLGNRI